MRDVFVAGVGMTSFGKFLDRGLKSLGREAISEAVDDAGATLDGIEAAYVGNAVGGLVTGQEMIRGQVVLSSLGLTGIPIFNVENACASASTAFHLAWQAVATGVHDIALAVGVEKLTHDDKSVSFDAIGTAVDLEAKAEMAAALGSEGEDRSFFMDIYAGMSRSLMERTGLTQGDFAQVVAKSHDHAALNPKAQYRNTVSPQEVLDSREIVWPLTLLMCSPIGDGGAAAILVSEDLLKRLGRDQDRHVVKVLASELTSGRSPHDANMKKSVVRASEAAYETAGVGPDDLDCIELHDATAPAELILYEELGLAKPEDVGGLLRDGSTHLGGKLPVNTSGGLLCKGHPIGATGIAQVVEIVEQLEGRAGDRQVEDAEIGLTENGGGWLGDDSAAAAVHIFGRTNV